MDNHKWVDSLEIHNDIKKTVKELYPDIVPQWTEIDYITVSNQLKVLEAFREYRVAEEDFNESSGYGYDDTGRDKLEKVFARAFGSEKALVRPQFLSGTHTLAVALFGLLRPGDKMLSVTGTPYDTLKRVIGNNTDDNEAISGTLAEWGIKYDELMLDEAGYPLLDSLKEKLNPEVKVAFIQRSPGYNGKRKSLGTKDIKEIISKIRSYRSDLTVIVDNCYGEFAETTEPTDSGADVIAGSLIKNPGGGLALSGGYIAGKEELVDKISNRFSAAGLGGHIGAVASKRYLFMGLFNAPTLTGNSLKSAVFAARLFELIGFNVKPRYSEARGDIVQTITFNDSELVKIFCSEIQKNSPVGSHLTPEPSLIPGYGDQVIMAAGTFIQGASGELSADAPMRDPYDVFLQGAFTLSHALIAICKTADKIYKTKICETNR